MHVWITTIIHRMHVLQIIDVRLYIHTQVPWYVSIGYTQLGHSSNIRTLYVKRFIALY